MVDKIYDIISKYDEEGNSECYDEIRDCLTNNGVDQCKILIDEIFYIQGYMKYSVSVAWVLDGKLQLVTGSIGVVK